MTPARILGLFLVVIGAALLVATVTGSGGELIVAFIGLAFLAGYASTRAYGLLIPGAILTGLGLGIVAESLGAPGEVVVLGLGLGFLVIPVVDLSVAPARAGWWWPLLPGGILTAIGAAELTGVQDAGRYAVPVVLIVIGLALLVRRSPGRELRSATPTTRPPADDDAPADTPAGAPTAEEPLHPEPDSPPDVSEHVPR
jgi:hypothetical protein